MFKTSGDYHELNAGAHRNSPKNLYAPALTWHLAFWIDKATSDQQQYPEDQQQNQGQNVDVRTKLDDFLLTLCKALKDDINTIREVRIRPCVPNNSSEEYFLLFKTVADKNFDLINSPVMTDRQKDILYSSSRAVSVEFKWRELCLSIRCEMHHEYFSITTFAEVDKDRDLKKLKELKVSNLEELNKKIKHARAYFDKKGTEAELKLIEADLNPYFFRGFWKSYEDHISAYPAVADLCKGEDSIFRRIFADFRGIVLSDKAVELPSDKEFFEGNELPSWGVAARMKFFPLLNAIKRLREYECSVSYMLDGRAMYMSALAPQLPDTSDEERIPLEFILYARCIMVVRLGRT